MRGLTLAEALVTGRGIERSFLCPVHDDHNASASVNVAAMVWVCYSCGASGRVDGEATIPDPDQLLAILKGDQPPREYPESWLDVFDADGPSPYWAGRYGEEVASYYRCGTHPASGLPTYPIRDEHGRVNGVVVRDEHASPKYRYPYGSRTSRTFFGLIHPSPVIVLVEGAGDVMALADLPHRVLGCYGAGLHAPQVEIIRGLNPLLVVLAFDDDDAGRAAMSRSASYLSEVTHCVSYPWGTLGAKDPGELPVGVAAQGLADFITHHTRKAA